MIIPVNHALSEQAIATYKVEPYVVTADVYATPSHLGRGGWSWYTGSAGWMYRLLLESLLGLRLEGENLHFVPCLPTDWQAFKIHYRYRETVYHISLAQIRRLDEQGGGIASVTVDGLDQHDRTVHLVDDHREHSIEVVVFAP
jgi:cellobiose phosphorylase